ncbi:MAG: DegT/DnrJ/EryC1/StrS family aminotransferase [Rhodothermales bacterium]|nr:DegT/DnrJ/EryC1/StrS family aminotransferase [Rhodothermales bacterium]
MHLQMVDLQAEVAAIRDELDAAIAAVLEAGAFVRGPFVARFEEELAGHLGGRFALGVGNGTDALQLAYMAAGVGPGDEVITSAFTFFATAEAASLLGATPVFVDVDPKTFNLDPQAVAAAVTERTRAVVPVHLFGQSADMGPLRATCERHGLALIEDAAQAVGARYGDAPAGYVGDVGCLSFYPSKNLGAYGDGGALLTNSEERYRELKKLANHGARRKYYHDAVGVNSRLDGLQAAVLSVKLRHLDAWTAARRVAASLYDAHLAGCDLVERPHRAPGRTHVFHQYTVRVPAAVRDGLREHLRAQGVPTMVYYPVPLHRLPVYEGLGYAEGGLPEAERASREVLSLPMHPWLTPEQIAFVAGQVTTYLERAAVEA